MVLLSFRVANHRSFRDEQELLLLPAYDKSVPATPVAAVYGANASGKSNLLHALRTMRTAALASFSQWGPLGGVPREPFALARAARDEPSTFGVDLLLDGAKYVYGFAVDDERVLEEWLYHYPRGRRRILFERKADDFRFGDSLRGPKNVIEEVTRPNSLFLSAAAHHGMEQLLPIYSWFARELTFADPDDRATRHSRTLELLEEPAAASRMLRLIKAADLGIDHVLLVKRKARPEAEEISEPVDAETADQPRYVITRGGSGKTQAFVTMITEAIRRSGDTDLFERSDSDVDEPFTGLRRRASPIVAMIRNTPDGPVPLSLEQESKGTRTWFDFLGLIIDVLDNGRVACVDELDSSLHPLMAREFVRLFQNPETNPHGAQLVFTTHDTSLLARHKGEEILRRDEIWFTEKNRAGETQLYPLTDFKPRSGLNWERRYLGGSVGAVPFLDEEEFVAAVGEGNRADG